MQKELTKEVFPYWYGTEWDFNGYTNKPGEGKIACGYFVSTTLKDAGAKVNRYKLAQQYSHKIVTVLSCGNGVKRFSNITSKVFAEKVKSEFKDGLYVIGLDHHVGFILKENSEVYFIHASYRDPVQVVKEKASESAALGDTDVFVIAGLTNNPLFLKQWIEWNEFLVN